MSRMPTEAEVKPTFERLDVALAKQKLQRTGGGMEHVHADEFMLMQFGDKGEAQFKHRDSRNYVYLFDNGYLFVPKTETPFNRGEF